MSAARDTAVDTSKVVGVLLAGGLARRMGGGDKCMRTLGGRPLLDRLIDAVRPQVGTLILNANGDPARFRSYDLEVVHDVIDGYAGPLAGVLTGLEWAAANAPEAEWVASFATDAPFLPNDLAARLLGAVAERGAEMACAASGGRTHPVFGLWPVALRTELRRAMVEDDMRKIDRWTAGFDLVEVPFDPVGGLDPFFNVNHPENLEEAERFLEGARA
jgi:molybdopterin-guanine dinucleotide biosynthesis protein A